MEGDNTRVDAIERDFGKVPIGNEPALVASIMLHVKDEVNTDLPETFRGFASLA